MERFRSARGGRRRRARWLAALAGTCLAAIVAGWPAAPAPGAAFDLTAARARVVNPGPPTGLAATAGNAQVSLSWAPPASDGGAAIIGYNVYRGTSSGGESGPVNGGLISGTSYTASGLTNGTTYYFTVEAVNGAQLSSGPSNQASATPAAPVTAPGAPTGLSASPGDAQVSLSWTAPAANGGTAITGYNVYEGTTASFKDTAPAATASGTSVTVKGLTDGTTYYFRVTAVNKAGQSAASGTASATPAAAITAPGTPSGLTATPGNGRVTLSWRAPSSDGGAKISGYLVYQGTSPGGESASPVTQVKGMSDTVTGLTNGTTYYFKVAAVNSAKRQGKDSGEASATPKSAASSPSASASASRSPSTGPSGSTGSIGSTAGAGAPGAPTGLTATPGNARVSLSWTVPTALTSTAGSPVTRYEVYEGTSPGFQPSAPVTSTTTTSTTVTGLTNGTTYYFAVAAVYADGTVSGPSGEVSAEPSGTAVLTAKRVSKPVIFSLAAVAIVALAAALALGARRFRPRSRPPAMPPSDVRAVPDKGPPGPVTVEDIVPEEEIHTVRLELYAGVISTTIEEIRS